MPDTSSIRTTDTLSWHPKKLALPGDSLLETVAALASDLKTALTDLCQHDATTASKRKPISDMTETATGILEELKTTFPKHRISEQTPQRVVTNDLTTAEHIGTQRVREGYTDSHAKINTSDIDGELPQRNRRKRHKDDIKCNTIVSGRPKRKTRPDYNTHNMPPLHDRALTSATLDTERHKLQWRAAKSEVVWQNAANAEFDRLIEKTGTMKVSRGIPNQRSDWLVITTHN
jgi:hypothetical protein